MPDLKSQDLVTHSFHHLKEKAFILPPAAQKEISRQKKMSYHGINLLIVQMPLKKLNILVAHYVKHLSPQQQAACYDDYQ
ncbi:hypothetical protein [Klebsiella pneumoniae ISC21]|nr:hypothetical protein [Klebsiella pneumoniae ISC21]